MNQELAIYEERAITLAQEPAQAILQAQKAAAALMDVVEQRKLYTMIRNRKYLHIEGWQILGAFYGITVRTEDAPEAIMEGERWMGARAHAVALHRGEIVAGAWSACMRDEENWDKAPRFAVESMAQTRAMAKAYRSVLAYVAELAGYAPTPAEEMVREPAPAQPAARRAPARTREAASPASFGPQIIAVANSMGWDDEELGAWLQANNFISEGKLVHGDVALTEIHRLARTASEKQPPQEEP